MGNHGAEVCSSSKRRVHHKVKDPECIHTEDCKQVEVTKEHRHKKSKRKHRNKPKRYSHSTKNVNKCE